MLLTNRGKDDIVSIRSEDQKEPKQEQAMRRQLTSEEQAKREQRKQRFAAIARKVAGMTEQERDAMSAQMLITTIEGHPLSARNNCMIEYQRPGCTLVGGFRQWLANGRAVRKGETGLMILVPHNAKKPEGSLEGEEGGVYFATGTVFDVSQTDEIAAGADAAKAEEVAVA